MQVWLLILLLMWLKVGRIWSQMSWLIRRCVSKLLIRPLPMLQLVWQSIVYGIKNYHYYLYLLPSLANTSDSFSISDRNNVHTNIFCKCTYWSLCGSILNMQLMWFYSNENFACFIFPTYDGRRAWKSIQRIFHWRSMRIV